MDDEKYRVATRYLGYKRVMEETFNNVIRVKDPDGRRYGYYVIFVNINEVNDFLMQMVSKGYCLKSQVEYIK